MTIYNSVFESFDGNEIYNNTFTHILNPVRLTYNTYVRQIAANTFRDNLEDGIVIYSSAVNNILNNTFSKQSTLYSGRDAFWIYNSAPSEIFNLMIRDNIITYGSQDGIRCEYYAAPKLGGVPEMCDDCNFPGNNKITNNVRYGVHAQSTTTPFLGDFNSSYCYYVGGRNSIHSNGNKQLYVATSSQAVYAKANWWGQNPDTGNGFTSATMNTLFGNSYPMVDPALWSWEPHPLIAGGEDLGMESSTSVQKEFAISTEPLEKSSIVSLQYDFDKNARILLVLADQLMSAKLYKEAVAVYDSLIQFYSSSDEAEAALLQMNGALRIYNSAVVNKLLSGNSKNRFQYFASILTNKAGTRLERTATELAALNASAEGNIAQAITLHQNIVSKWPNSESEKNSLAALIELHWMLDDKAAANKYVAELQSKYADDPVAALLLDTK